MYCALRTVYETDEGNHTTTISEYALTDSFAVAPGEELTFEVALDVPVWTPATTYGDVDVWLDTGLDIDWAKDPDDKDALRVDPDARLAALHDAIGSLGFELESVAVVTATGTPFATDREFVQEFEYRPLQGEYRQELDELEVVVNPGRDRLAVAMEVDAADSLLSERETVTEFTIATTDEGDIADEVRERIDENY